ncbi:MAG: hypothetical protein M1831_000093 [Alyxoria varia]|nr:MAG: hypothetical protein M1831_000093 [Alyxoria varia]
MNRYYANEPLRSQQQLQSILGHDDTMGAYAYFNIPGLALPFMNDLRIQRAFYVKAQYVLDHEATEEALNNLWFAMEAIARTRHSDHLFFASCDISKGLWERVEANGGPSNTQAFSTLPTDNGNHEEGANEQQASNGNDQNTEITSNTLQELAEVLRNIESRLDRLERLVFAWEGGQSENDAGEEE